MADTPLVRTRPRLSDAPSTAARRGASLIDKSHQTSFLRARSAAAVTALARATRSLTVAVAAAAAARAAWPRAAAVAGVAAIAAGLLGIAGVPPASAPVLAQGVKTVRDDAAVFTLMLQAEDRRPQTRAGALPLLRGLDSDAAGVQDAALLGLGRLENPEFVPDIAKMLESPVPAVRSQAANALAQAVTNGDARLAAEPLRVRARIEKDPNVRGTIARSLGRLPYRTMADVRDAEDAIVALSWSADAAGASRSASAASNAGTTREDSAVDTLFGVAHGLASLARKSARFATPQPPAAAAAAAPQAAAARANASAPATTRQPPALQGAAAPQSASSQAAASQQTSPQSAASQSGAPTTAPQAATAGANVSAPTSTRQPPASQAAAALQGASAAAPLPWFSAPTLARLRQLARHGVKADSTEATEADRVREANRRVRRLTLMALASAKDVDVPLLEGSIADPDEQVRRLTLLAAMANGPSSIAAQLAERARRDVAFSVRYEALRVHARLRAAVAAAAPSAANGAGGVPIANAQATDLSCQPELDALSDANAQVVLLAIDQLGDCGGQSSVADRLTPLVDERAKGRPVPNWHRPAHALVSLARVAPDRAAARLTPLVEDEVWEVRAYAAKAAGVLKDRARLDALAQDPNDNVRNAALEALRTLAGHDADRIYLAQLTRHDYQLVRTAAMALKDTPLKSEMTAAAFDALARITADRKDTSRDPRMALLDALASVGAGAGAQIEGATARLQPYLSDFDPAIAERAASILSTWIGQPQKATPHRLIPVAPPTWKTVHAEQERGASAIVHMAGGRTFTIALFPLEAPTNVMRFIHQARAGDFNGLTFHRVEPNFVIQGGSPHANEYTGDARFTRDEVTMRPQVRGTVGISTRGHDTGDGQIYVNLVDNYRLDHNYTLIGVITDGMDNVDAILEGDVIDRIELRSSPQPR